MSLIYENRTVEAPYIIAKQCNKCGKIITQESSFIEWQEFFHLNILCQQCVHELLKKYIKEVKEKEDE